MNLQEEDRDWINVAACAQVAREALLKRGLTFAPRKLILTRVGSAKRLPRLGSDGPIAYKVTKRTHLPDLGRVYLCKSYYLYADVIAWITRCHLRWREANPTASLDESAYNAFKEGIEDQSTKVYRKNKTLKRSK